MMLPNVVRNQMKTCNYKVLIYTKYRPQTFILQNIFFWLATNIVRNVDSIDTSSKHIFFSFEAFV